MALKQQNLALFKRKCEIGDLLAFRPRLRCCLSHPVCFLTPKVPPSGDNCHEGGVESLRDGESLMVKTLE